MVHEAGIAMLACTRIGAIHSVVFGGFSSDALAVRIQDCQAKILVVCDGTFRGAKAVPQKKDADVALAE
jgi:acetyl-CoA synthetase